MLFLIQSNIHADPEHHRIFAALEELGLECLPFHLEGQSEINIGSDRNDVFVYGSVKLARLARAQTHWKPGSFYGENHRYPEYAPHYGDHLLNWPSTSHTFAGVMRWQPGELKFIKPLNDAKVFTGRVFAQAEWEDFVHESLAQPRTPLLHASTLILCSQPRRILKEARIWIIDGQVVAGVYYRFHGDQPFEAQVAPEGIEFARSMATRFQAAPAFVMDIGLTDEGWRIIELNCINSAGLYSLSPKTLFRALNIYFG